MTSRTIINTSPSHTSAIPSSQKCNLKQIPENVYLVKLCTVYLLAYQVRITVDDSGLYWCVPCLSSAINSIGLL